MSARLRQFLRRHPSVCDALVWAVPALIFGAILRALLTSYLPYAFWGADSRSYFSFAHRIIADHYVSLDEKRRFLYPILLLPVSLLPGAPLRWLLLFQHGLGVATLVPLAYVVRKNLVFWRLWIVPVTVLFAGLPVVVWYEHELLGENVFFALFIWAFAGWSAWTSEPRLARARRLFWCFFVPFALFILTKPSGRFVWPGILAGIVLLAAWRRMGRWQIVALGLLIPITLTVGSRKQAAWLLYTAVFPLTQLDTPLHADYKAQIRDLVEPLARTADTYYLHDGVPFNFLERPGDHPERPLWQALAKDEKLKSSVYSKLAIEAIAARPAMFINFGIQRAVASSNMSSFGINRFSGDFYRDRAERRYTEAVKEENGAVRLAHGLPRHGPLPSYDEFLRRLDPHPDSWQELALEAWNSHVSNALEFSQISKLLPKEERTLSHARVTLLGWWLAAGALLAAFPPYSRTLGIWTLLALGYVLGVFIVSQENARYFAPVWPVIIVLLAVPADALVRLAAVARARQ